jgi:predicted transcriptional regulator
MTEQPVLSRREREVMDIVHELAEATATQIQECMADPPTNAAVRSILRILVEKGHVTFTQDGPRYVYSASVSGERARESAMRHVLRTFFGGSVEGAVAALLELDESAFSPAERTRLKKMIDQAAKEGR